MALVFPFLGDVSSVHFIESLVNASPDLINMVMLGMSFVELEGLRCKRDASQDVRAEELHRRSRKGDPEDLRGTHRHER